MSVTIYLITNSINGHTYVGKTSKTLEERFKKHRYDHKNTNSYIHKAMRKYGFDNFSIEELESNVPDERECYWIEKLNPTYNLTKGGDGGDTSNSPKFIESMKKYHSNKPKESYATYGMLGKKNPNAIKAMNENKRVKVMVYGTLYDSIKDAQEANPGICIRKRLKSPKHPECYRLIEC